MRSIKELLQLMLDNQQRFDYGLCHWSDALYGNGIITGSEHTKLKRYIKNNRPFLTRIVRWYDMYWWKEGDITPRIKWIKKHIKKNS